MTMASGLPSQPNRLAPRISAAPQDFQEGAMWWCLADLSSLQKLQEGADV